MDGVVFHNSAEAVQTYSWHTLRLVIDVASLQIGLSVLTGWLARRERATRLISGRL